MHKLIFMPKKIIFIAILLISNLIAAAQIVNNKAVGSFNADSIRAQFDNGPYFTLFRDNYFILGTTLGGRPTRTNSDVKFQISIAQRLTKSTLPFNTYLFLTYSQKCMWNVFEESLPMRDLNFNPGIGIAKLLIVKDKLIGKAMLIELAELLLADHRPDDLDPLVDGLVVHGLELAANQADDFNGRHGRSPFFLHSLSGGLGGCVVRGLTSILGRLLLSGLGSRGALAGGLGADIDGIPFLNFDKAQLGQSLDRRGRSNRVADSDSHVGHEDFGANIDDFGADILDDHFIYLP